MIATAITQMIQSSQYFIFLESENSIADIEHNKFYNNMNEKSTESPWIYFELKVANMFNQKEIMYGYENFLESSEENRKISMKCFLILMILLKIWNK